MDLSTWIVDSDISIIHTFVLQFSSEDGLRSIVSGRPRDSPARVGPRPAQEEVLDRHLVGRVPGEEIHVSERTKVSCKRIEPTPELAAGARAGASSELRERCYPHESQRRAAGKEGGRKKSIQE